MRALSISGGVALVDDEEYERLMQYTWHTVTRHGTTYARRQVRVDSGTCRQRPRYMHQDVCGHNFADHIDGNGLNNQRSNLRPSDRFQNAHNRGKHAPTSSSYKGVSWHGQTGKWRARIMDHNRPVSLGLHPDEAVAALAYDIAAKERFGEFARLNFLEDEQ